jgi:hypothetical protein
MGNISVILNVYKRGYTLESQILAIKNQTIKVNSEDIHIWYNTADSAKIVLPLDKNIKTYQCSYNTKFWGRFTLPLLCKTQYIAMFDDDIIPGNKWLENCLNSIKKRDGILGGSGVITEGTVYKPYIKIGWNGFTYDNPADVDLVGHAWFFKQEYAKLMWSEKPSTWDNGEDIFFAYMAQKNGIPTYVPPHPTKDRQMWSNLSELASTNGVDWGVDANSHSVINRSHTPVRNQIVSDLRKRGWKTIKGI